MPEYSADQKTDLTDIQEHERYLLRSGSEIVRVLNDLKKRPDIITGYFDGGSKYLLTAVLEILPERNLVVFDYGQNEALNRGLLESGRMVGVTRHNNIRIRFSVEGLQRARLKGQTVLAATIPETLFRLQRREFFRVSTPQVTPVTCVIPAGVPLAGRHPLADISSGGVCLIVGPTAPPIELESVIEACHLELPESSPLLVDLQIRNIRRLTRRQGEEYRVGCAFVNVGMDTSVAIQRYINRLQVELKTATDR